MAEGGPKEKENYVASLDEKEKLLFELYEEVRAQKSVGPLLEAVEDGRLEINERDKDGVTPFLIACDCELEAEELN